MFNKKLSNEIDSLKREVFGPPRKKEAKDFYGRSFYEMFYGVSFSRSTLKEHVDSLGERLTKQEKLITLLLEHSKLEYVKLTEENGSKKSRRFCARRKVSEVVSQNVLIMITMATMTKINSSGLTPPFLKMYGPTNPQRNHYS